MTDLELAVTAAAAAADEIRRLSGDRAADYKGATNPVTEADRCAEAAIVALLTEYRPADGILTEEGSDAESSSGRRWVIDPLDGTVNYLHGIPQVAVSIALETEDGPTGAAVGVIHDVFREEVFTAVRGEGSRLNGEPISVSPTEALDRALVVTGFPYDRHTHARQYTDVVAAVLERVEGVRRLGSAALDLAWIACGRFDGYWEFKLQPWDVAAGIVLVTEAGGTVSSSDGGLASHHDIVASNGLIHEALRSVVAGASAS
jgi:myo-inositol-1(or 4)-monophosphatase